MKVALTFSTNLECFNLTLEAAEWESNFVKTLKIYLYIWPLFLPVSTGPIRDWPFPETDQLLPAAVGNNVLQRQSMESMVAAVSWALTSSLLAPDRWNLSNM